jgi:superfamily II DNA or RNA helicase
MCAHILVAKKENSVIPNGLENADIYLERIITKYLKANLSIDEIIRLKCAPDDMKMQNRFMECYSKLILTSTSLKLKSDIREYQTNYKNKVFAELVSNSICSIECPTGGGKSQMFMELTGMIYLKNMCDKKLFEFNVLLITPRLKLCEQSIGDKYKSILREYGIKAKYLQYNSVSCYETEKSIIGRRIGRNVFISSTYQSLEKLIAFLESHKIIIHMAIFDEYHYIQSWTEDPIKLCNITHPLMEKRLFTSATPYDIQKKKVEIYGNTISEVRVKDLIDLGYLCPIVPLIEVETTNNSTNNIANISKLIYDTFNEFKKKKAMLFCNNKKSCCKMYNEIKHNLNEVGIKVFKPYIDLTNKEKKTLLQQHDLDDICDNYDNLDKYINEFESYNDPCIFITCRKIDVGYDHPPIDLIIIADEKHSLVDIAQSVGRGLRLSYEGKVCHILLPINQLDINNGKYDSILNYMTYLKNNVGITDVDNFIKDQHKRQISKLKRLTSSTGSINESEPLEDIITSNITLIKDLWIKILDKFSIEKNKDYASQFKVAIDKIIGCRDISKCFYDGQEIRHRIRKNIWTAIYKNDETAIIHNNVKYYSLSSFSAAHYKAERPDRTTSSNGWFECQCKLESGEWISTHNLPEKYNL